MRPEDVLAHQRYLSLIDQIEAMPVRQETEPPACPCCGLKRWRLRIIVAGTPQQSHSLWVCAACGWTPELDGRDAKH